MTFKVTFGALEQAASDIQTRSGSIGSTLDTMDSQLKPLQSDWTGAASESYTAAKAKWTQAAKDMQTLLTQIGSAVGQSNQSYQQGENANKNLWG